MERGNVKKLLVALVVGVVLLLAVLVTNAVRFRSRQVQVKRVAEPTLVDVAAAADRLGGAIEYRTISHEDSTRFEPEEFRAFHEYLEQSFPDVHRDLRRQVIGGYSLLFTWEGSDPTLRPVLFMGHLDVVPVEADAESEWTHPPFSGRIADGYIWGRGAMDDKVGVVGLMEATAELVHRGHRPARTVYLAFGHDEELGGAEGAARIASRLEARGVELSWVLDEGMVIARDLLPGLEQPVALIGVAEKGALNLELSVESPGGHSSIPPRETAVGSLARAIHRLERHPVPGDLDGPARQLLEYLGPEMQFLDRLALANLWLFGPLVERRLAGAPATDALLRTTTAPTMLRGSTKPNVLPSRASGVVNFRIHPADSIEGVIDHALTVIDDPRVRLRTLMAREASAVSSVESKGFRLLQRTAATSFPGTLVAPSIVLGGTDSRHYEPLTRNIYRFVPVRVGPADLQRFHGTDERISVENYGEVVRFYIQLLRAATS